MEEKYPLAQWLNNELKDNEVADFKKDTHIETYSKIKKYSAQLTASTFDEDKMLGCCILTKIDTISKHKTWQRKSNHLNNNLNGWKKSETSLMKAVNHWKKCYYYTRKECL